MPKRYVINLETGELTNEINEGDRILREASANHLQNNMSIPMQSFVKINSDEMAKVMPMLDMKERAVLVSMLAYVSYQSCCLLYKNGANINLDDITRISGVSSKTAITAVEGLIKKNIFYKGKNSKGNQYFVNPWIANKGMTVNTVLREMFKHYKIQTKGNIKWDDLHKYE